MCSTVIEKTSWSVKGGMTISIYTLVLNKNDFNSPFWTHLKFNIRAALSYGVYWSLYNICLLEGTY